MNVWDHYRLTCKCMKCERTQVCKINDIVAGEIRCSGGIGQPCGGELNYYADGHDSAQHNANSLLGYMNAVLFNKELRRNWPSKCEERLAELLDTVVDDIGSWEEGFQTPQEMGWVDSKGRP